MTAFFQFTHLAFAQTTQACNARMVQLAKDAQAKHGLWVDQVCVHGWLIFLGHLALLIVRNTGHVHGTVRDMAKSKLSAVVRSKVT